MGEIVTPGTPGSAGEDPHSPETARPRGFRGLLRNVEALLRRDAPGLHLPAPLDRGREEPPILSVPAGEADLQAIRIDGLAECLGALEPLLVQCARRLDEAGTLVLDCAAAESPLALRELLEPATPLRRGPAASLARPERRIELTRLLDALELAQLHVVDLIEVPARDRPGPGFADAVQTAGYGAARWLGPPPPDRYLVVARKTPTCSGTLVLLQDRSELPRRDADHGLPADWEVLPTAHTPQAIDRAISESRGELLLFATTAGLAGTTGREGLLRELLAELESGPVRALAVADGAPHSLTGLCLARREALRAGPLSAGHPDHLPTAVEDFLLRLDRLGRPVREVGPAEHAPRTHDDALDLARLAARWPQLRDPTNDGRARLPQRPDEPQRISLCMIVRDEEVFLGECLQRARPFVDEMVVVDTGSTDRTREIAAETGARVLTADWHDDFAAARNVALEAATGDWVLVLDADEFLDPLDAGRVRDAVRTPRAIGFNLRMQSLVGDGTEAIADVWLLRLFRRLPGVHFQGRIHEQVWPSLAAVAAAHDLVVGEVEATIVHHGYVDRIQAARAKQQRNERLFLLQLEERPEDVYTLYKYGDFLRSLPDRSTDAQEVLERGLDLLFETPPATVAQLPFAGELVALCALDLLRGGAPTAALQLCERGLRLVVPTPHVHQVAGSAALAAGRPRDALRHLHACLEFAGRTLCVPVQRGVTGATTWTGIAECWSMLGDGSRARRALDHALALDPAHEAATLQLARLELGRHDAGAALGALTDLLARRPDSQPACAAAARILRALGHEVEAEAIERRMITVGV